MDQNQNKKQPIHAISDDVLSAVAGGYNGDTVASGSFSSQTGTGLNLLVYWRATADSLGQKTLYVTVSSSSYSLYAGALPNSVELTVNGLFCTATPNAVQYSGNTLATHTLASFSIPNASSPASISAAWHFNGSYSGVALGTIRANGTANF